MFVIKSAAEIKNVNLRMEAHGDSLVRAVDIKMIVADVEAARLDSAIPEVGQFWHGEDPVLQEVYPLKVRHTIENVEAVLTVGKKAIKLKGADVRKVSITPRHSGRCEIELSIRCSEIGDGILDPLHKWLKGEVQLEVVERQISLPNMDQGEEKASG